MIVPRILDQELVVHLFAPLEGPRAEDTYHLSARCGQVANGSVGWWYRFRGLAFPPSCHQSSPGYRWRLW